MRKDPTCLMCGRVSKCDRRGWKRVTEVSLLWKIKQLIFTKMTVEESSGNIITSTVHIY